MGRFDGRRAAVTGGASGIGAATARRLAAEGAAVAVIDLNQAAGARVAEEIGGRFCAADVSDPASLAEALGGAAAALGGLDLVHLNAGVVTGESDIVRLTDSDYRRILAVNVDHVVLGTREAVRLMGGGGAIVATASLAGLIDLPTDPIYAATKHAVVGFVRSVAVQLAARGITINAICPGIVDTPLVGAEAAAQLRQAGFPLLAAEEVAEAVVRAVESGESGRCWVVQPGRQPLPYEFRGVPGPRVAGAEGRVPPGLERYRTPPPTRSSPQP